MSALAPLKPVIGVFYLARGADSNALAKFEAFRASYLRWPAGIGHQLYIIFKGFRNAQALMQGRGALNGLDYQAIHTGDEGFDLGAYFTAASQVDHDLVLFLNTASRICGPNWLRKLAAYGARPDVGMVSCTGSYEAPQHPDHQNIPFPNPHLRSNAFMMRRDRFLAMRLAHPILEKIDAYMLEHGANSMTRQAAAQGLKTLLVGRNGRGYEPPRWFASKVFRQDDQENLLIADNQTDAYREAPIPEKKFLSDLAWGNAATRHPLRIPTENTSEYPSVLADNMADLSILRQAFDFH